VFRRCQVLRPDLGRELIQSMNLPKRRKKRVVLRTGIQTLVDLAVKKVLIFHLKVSELFFFNKSGYYNGLNGTFTNLEFLLNSFEA